MRSLLRLLLLLLLPFFLPHVYGTNTLQTEHVVAVFQNNHAAVHMLPPRHERQYDISVTEMSIGNDVFLLSGDSGDAEPVEIRSEAQTRIHVILSGPRTNTSMSCVLPGIDDGLALSCLVRIVLLDSAVAALPPPTVGGFTRVRMQMSSAQRDTPLVERGNGSVTVSMQHGDAGNQGILLLETDDVDFGDAISIDVQLDAKHFRTSYLVLTWPIEQTTAVSFLFHASVVAASASQIRRNAFFILALFVSALCLLIIVYLAGRVCVTHCVHAENQLRSMGQAVGYHNLHFNAGPGQSLSRFKRSATAVDV
jgi:hypothetical protein